MTDNIVVLITVPGEDEASRIASTLINERLAACVNLVKNIRSLFRWEGKVEDESEFLMVVKTRSDIFERLSKRVNELHSYSVPEIIALPIIDGFEGYLQWIADETK
jgi:periplasmic divalent cation tolerance protein